MTSKRASSSCDVLEARWRRARRFRRRVRAGASCCARCSPRASSRTRSWRWARRVVARGRLVGGRDERAFRDVGKRVERAVRSSRRRGIITGARVRHRLGAMPRRAEDGERIVDVDDGRVVVEERRQRARTRGASPLAVAGTHSDMTCGCDARGLRSVRRHLSASSRASSRRFTVHASDAGAASSHATSNSRNGRPAMPRPSALTYASFTVHNRMKARARSSTSSMRSKRAASRSLNHRLANAPTSVPIRLFSSSTSIPHAPLADTTTAVNPSQCETLNSSPLNPSGASTRGFPRAPSRASRLSPSSRSHRTSPTSASRTRAPPVSYDSLSTLPLARRHERARAPRPPRPARVARRRVVTPHVHRARFRPIARARARPRPPSSSRSSPDVVAVLESHRSRARVPDARRPRRVNARVDRLVASPSPSTRAPTPPTRVASTSRTRASAWPSSSSVSRATRTRDAASLHSFSIPSNHHIATPLDASSRARARTFALDLAREMSDVVAPRRSTRERRESAAVKENDAWVDARGGRATIEAVKRESRAVEIERRARKRLGIVDDRDEAWGRWGRRRDADGTRRGRRGCSDAPGCARWRRVPRCVGDALGRTGSGFTCADGRDGRFNSCARAQEATDREIDAILDESVRADEEAKAASKRR